MPLHNNIAAFFAPRAIALVGASRHVGKIGHTLLANLLHGGFQGHIFPINPNAENILGLPCLGKIEDLPLEHRPLDLAVLCLPANVTPEAMRALAAVPTRAAIVISAGFKETGPQGALLEMELMAIAREAGIALLGPNCLGIVAPHRNLNVTFAKADVLSGNIGFFSQSGAFCIAMLDWASEQNIGFSSFVSLGNKAIIDESDMLACMADDPDTKVIAGYLESVENGPRFLQNAHIATRKKPVILLKAGRSNAGARAASSHTGALAGSDLAYEAAFTQTGIIRVERMEDLFGIAQAFADQPMPKGDGIALITNAGGPGIVATDAIEAAGLTLSRLSHATIQALKDILPPFATIFNPVDVISDAPVERIAAAAAVALADPAVHSLLVLAASSTHTPLDTLALHIANLPNPDRKPLYACLMGGKNVAEARRTFAEHSIPCYPFPEQAITAMAAMLRQSRWKENPLPVEVGYRHDAARVRTIIENARKDNILEIAEFQAQGILRAYEIPSLETRLARTSDEAVQIARQLGGVVALKLASPQVLHKTDLKGVVLHLDTPEKVRSAFLEITGQARKLHKEAYIAGCLVQAMAPPQSREVVVGFKRDRRFGPMVIFGLGGIHVEAFKDISCRLAPLSLDDVHDMVREIKAFPILAGMRGQRPVKFEAIEDILLIMSQLAVDSPEIQEAECNPVFANPEVALVADIRLLLTPYTRLV